KSNLRWRNTAQWARNTSEPDMATPCHSRFVRRQSSVLFLLSPSHQLVILIALENRDFGHTQLFSSRFCRDASALSLQQFLSDRAPPIQCSFQPGVWGSHRLLL